PRPRRDDGAVRELRAGTVVVGDDDVEAGGARLGDLGDGRDPAVDREHEPAAVVGESRQRRAADAVALVEATRQVPLDVRSEVAQHEDGERRRTDAVDVVVAVDADPLAGRDRAPDPVDGLPHAAEQEGVVRRQLALEEGARDVGVAIAAPDEDARRQLADAELLGELGVQPVRARTHCPGALIHGGVTVGTPPDDILGAVRELFLLDPEIVYLNHGSFGACPRPVFERYQAWQLELEREPADLLLRRLPELLARARADLAAYVGAAADDLTFVQNAGTGVNMAARALDLAPGDEILSTSLEYGACDYTWEHVCRRAGARYVRASIPLPLDDVVERLFAERTERTRAVYVSHITSETGLLLPVEAIVSRARDEGLVTIVDGAHAPAHVDLDLAALGADFYAGNCHKWLCAPKGCAFLHVRDDWKDHVDGSIVSWGYGEEPATFLSRTEHQGTRDPAAYLAVSEAIAFVTEHDERERCVALAREARKRLCELLGSEPLGPDAAIRQLVSVQLPTADPDLSRRLFDEHRIEIPTMGPRRHDLLRLSVASYTTREDVERLLDALPHVL
ncbi:MAG: isopenicillin-N epimerase, partial [Gaiellaceae bacterium]|nr:isopenicillin-N epimerase [Gaiellaceae bacterium]